MRLRRRAIGKILANVVVTAVEAAKTTTAAADITGASATFTAQTLWTEIELDAPLKNNAAANYSVFWQLTDAANTLLEQATVPMLSTATIPSMRNRARVRYLMPTVPGTEYTVKGRWAGGTGINVVQDPAAPGTSPATRLTVKTA